MAPEPSGKKENLRKAGEQGGVRYKRDFPVRLYVFPDGDRFCERTLLSGHAIRASIFSIALCLLKDYSKSLVSINREMKTKRAEFGRRGTPLQVSTSSPTSTGFGQETLLFGHAIRVSAL